MALQFGQRIILLLLVCFVNTVQAQKVYYPAGSSDMLRSTADDVASLFNKSLAATEISSQSYNALPASGIIFIYDSSITNDQTCKIESDGATFIKFSASQDNSLCFGIYNYLNELGFRFYLPGSLWEKIPLLSSPFKIINKVVSGTYKYNTWNISGGCNRWVMDNNDSYGWDVYFGENGHQWAKYQRRNNMSGVYKFNGHRGDILDAEYMSGLQSNTCYIACNDGKRIANSTSVPDINNENAMQYWADKIQQRYTYHKNIVSGNPALYANLFHNFNYHNKVIGIEVADGAKWGNSSDNVLCATGNYNGNAYPKESDQQFLLANYTATKINTTLGDKQFQCYAYSNHADVPSLSVSINKNIDVQVVPGAFQSFTSTKGLLNRWYQVHKNISEYHYLNIPQWTGETPNFSLNEFKNTLYRIKENKGQGLVIETSPSKFASFPFLYAGNRFLLNNINVDESLNEFVADMFPAETGVYVKQLLQYWGDENIFSNSINDNKYKLPLYLQQLGKAVTASSNINNKAVTARLQEMKAYMHYMVLYYDFISDPSSYENKAGKASALCLYLGKINKLQLVNSYFLLFDIVNKYPKEHAVYTQYNVIDGTAYHNGNVALINDDEINKNFTKDLLNYGNLITNYKFENASTIISKMKEEGLKPLDTINVKIIYTNGFEYPNKSEFYFYAPFSGTVNINCAPHFEMPGKGFVNITVEDEDKPLFIIADQTIDASHNPGNILINVPYSGIFRVSIISKYKTKADIKITTNGNIFFKQGAFYGNKVEHYQDDWASLPQYIYVPKQLDELYFSIDNSCYTKTCLSPAAVKNAFGIKDKNDKDAIIQTTADPSLYKIVTSNSSGFWRISTMREYNLCLANISNIEIYAEKEKPSGAALPIFNTDVICYPNPSADIFNFKKNNASLFFDKINIYNPQGKLIAIAENTSRINLSGLPAGIYFFSVSNENVITKGKLIKN